MKQYYNFKNFYSVVLLALVDASYRFTWVSLVAPSILTTIFIFNLQISGTELRLA